jgi:hypothetical protein
MTQKTIAQRRFSQQSSCVQRPRRECTVRVGEHGLTDGRTIDVTVKNGVVHLERFVESGEDLKRSLEDAHAVRGVVTVDSEMELKRGQSRGNGT